MLLGGVAGAAAIPAAPLEGGTYERVPLQECPGGPRTAPPVWIMLFTLIKWKTSTISYQSVTIGKFMLPLSGSFLLFAKLEYNE